MKILLALVIIFSFAFSYGKSIKVSQACTYEFDVDNSKVAGTGFKYTEKTGVTAQFSGLKLNKKEKQSSVKKLLEGLVVTIDLMTLDSGNSLRDKNMRETLFSGILGDSVATITVKNVTDKKIDTEFKMNEKTQNISFTYSIKDEMINAKGSFDVLKFALGDQLAALKKRCASLHTGSDGKSVTWSDFALSVKAKIKKVCK